MTPHKTALSSKAMGRAGAGGVTGTMEARVEPEGGLSSRERDSLGQLNSG